MLTTKFATEKKNVVQIKNGTDSAGVTNEMIVLCKAIIERSVDSLNQQLFSKRLASEIK